MLNGYGPAPLDEQEFTHLPIPACPDLANILGYRWDASGKWVSFYYVPGSSVWDDGRMSASGYDWNFVAFTHLLGQRLGIPSHLFGSDDSYSHSHRVLLHVPTSYLYLIDEKHSQMLLAQQWVNQPLPFEQELNQLRAEFGEAVARLTMAKALAEVTERPFDLLGMNSDLAALRTQMLKWYEEYFDRLSQEQPV